MSCSSSPRGPGAQRHGAGSPNACLVLRGLIHCHRVGDNRAKVKSREPHGAEYSIGGLPFALTSLRLRSRLGGLDKDEGSSFVAECQVSLLPPAHVLAEPHKGWAAILFESLKKMRVSRSKAPF